MGLRLQLRRARSRGSTKMKVRRYVHKHPLYNVEYDQHYIVGLQKYFLMDRVKTAPGNLYGFVNEAGDQSLTKDHWLFALSGCMFMGQLDQRCLDAGWHELRRDVFKVPRDKPYRSKKHLGKVKSDSIKKICELLGDDGLKFFSCYVTHQAIVTTNPSWLTC